MRPQLATAFAPVQAPAIARLAALAPLGSAAVAALTSAIGETRTVPARRELLTEGRPIASPLLIVTGWAARVRLLIDGRRQFMSFLLPGDLVGLCDHAAPVAVSTVVALTDVTVAVPPSREHSPELANAYAISRALEEAYLLAQITRLGRLDAHERILDLLLELDERLSLCGMADEAGFDIPLTQEALADALGLTAVHVNRMLQHARRRNELSWRTGRVSLANRAALARSVGRTPVRVSSTQLG